MRLAPLRETRMFIFGRRCLCDAAPPPTGGYSAADRRDIERRIFTGEARAVIETNALELGVDIGTLDAVVALGFPSSISSLRQQFGRAGRGTREALCVFVALSDPIDVHFAAHPLELLERPAEACCLSPANPRVLGPHLLCALKENNEAYGRLPVSGVPVPGVA
eukprot:GHVU01160007.1.p3 GENE.GHVU01160007.1~~GHVU01160007.1.p3  ORF type:complete len:164 (+),score=22.64 GHVU01160007.1:631-1122(+)